MNIEEDQKIFKLVKCVSKNESDDKAGLLIEEPTGDIELNLLTVEKRCRISLVSENWDFNGSGSATGIRGLSAH